MFCMRTTLDLDETLVLQAMRETGARSKTELVERGLRALLEREARKRLKALYGDGPRLRPARRRRT
jgi:Arc/MetJ family transcription regulator